MANRPVIQVFKKPNTAILGYLSKRPSKDITRSASKEAAKGPSQTAAPKSVIARKGRGDSAQLAQDHPSPTTNFFTRTANMRSTDLSEEEHHLANNPRSSLIDSNRLSSQYCETFQAVKAGGTKRKRELEVTAEGRKKSRLLTPEKAETLPGNKETKSRSSNESFDTISLTEYTDILSDAERVQSPSTRDNRQKTVQKPDTSQETARRKRRHGDWDHSDARPRKARRVSSVGTASASPATQESIEGGIPRGLENYQAASYINAAMQCLHSLPEIRTMFSDLSKKDIETVLEDENGWTDENWVAASKRSQVKNAIKNGIKARQKFDELLAERVLHGKLSFSRHTGRLFIGMSDTHHDDGTLKKAFNPIVFSQVAGHKLPKVNPPEPKIRYAEKQKHMGFCKQESYNGETLQNSGAFLREVISRLQSEQNRAGTVDGFFKTGVDIQRNCPQCGHSRCLKINVMSLNVSLTGKSLSLQEMLKRGILQAGEESSELCCHSCSATFTDESEGDKVRIRDPSRYLLFQVRRPGRGVTNKKQVKMPRYHETSDNIAAIIDDKKMFIRYRVKAAVAHVPPKSISYSVDENSLDYRNDRGFCVAYRREGDQWYKCSDEDITAVTDSKARQAMELGELFIFEKIDRDKKARRF